MQQAWAEGSVWLAREMKISHAQESEWRGRDRRRGRTGISAPYRRHPHLPQGTSCCLKEPSSQSPSASPLIICAFLPTFSPSFSFFPPCCSPFVPSSYTRSVTCPHPGSSSFPFHFPLTTAARITSTAPSLRSLHTHTHAHTLLITHFSSHFAFLPTHYHTGVPQPPRHITST